jgi:hypothetical protein
MFNRKTFAGFALAFATVTPLLAQLELPRLSPKGTVSQRIGLTDVTITYSRPNIRGRAIWGALVPYDQVWRTGANEATTFEVSDDVMINGSKLAKGKYSLATIPGRQEWTLIFNRDPDLWGANSYDESKDALRVTAKPKITDHAHESLMFAFPEVTPSSARAILAWEKIEVPFTIEVDTKGKAQANIDAALTRMEDWRTPYQAANYAFQFDAVSDDAVRWVDRSIALKETYQNVSLKAQLLAKQGKTREAIMLADRALKLAQSSATRPDTAQLEKSLAEWKTKAGM